MKTLAKNGPPQLRKNALELISSSWLRCRQYGLASHQQMRQHILPNSDLHFHQERSWQLRQLALHEMHLLEHQLVDGGQIMLLADANGVVLDSRGDIDCLGRGGRVSLMPGASWEEQIAGTNGIGTAIFEKRFVQIIGSQHYFAESRFLACSAMPIHSPDGFLVGVLDLSGNAHRSAAPAAKLVRHAVADIEHRWVAESATETLLHLHQHPSWLGTPDEGLLAFQDGILTGANSRAMSFLGLSASDIHSTHWYEIFDQQPRFGLQELHTVEAPRLFYANLARAQKGSARFAASQPVSTRPETLADLKDEALRQAVADENGNITAAARKLGIHRSTVYRRLGN